MRRKIEYGCAAMMAIMLMFFAILGIMAIVLTVSAKSPQHVPDSLNMGTYSVVYDPDLLIPVSADWVIDRQFLGSAKRVPSWRFCEDPRVDRPRACHDDYTRSGYDRGHMCPAGDRSAGSDLMRSTFIMTNVAPQAPSLNRGAWMKMEEECRSMARNGRSLTIHVDAIFWHADTQRIGSHRVAVPHAFVKTVRDLLTDTICQSKYFQND